MDKTIALIGVSKDERKFGFKIFRDMIDAGWNVRGINPKGGEVLGRKVYKSLNELEPVPDIAVTVVPPQITEKIVDECIKLGVKEIWMQPGSESENAIKKAKENGMKVVHNACIVAGNSLLQEE